MHHRDERVFVDIVLSVGLKRAARRENVDAHTVVARPMVAAACDMNRNMMGNSLPHSIVERAAAIRLSAIKNLVDMQRANDARECTDVIAVGN